MKLKCLHCGHILEADFDCVDTPIGGISLLATGNYGSSVWDPMVDDMSFTAWLCDKCFTVLEKNMEYFVFKRGVRVK